MPSIADIDHRSGWPEELCVLLEKFPRATWQQHMTPLTHFWIEKHNDFRNQCSALQSATDEFRQRPDDLDAFASNVASPTRFFVAMLHGHHQIEDFHYFPAFRAADPSLAAGFDVLASDHKLLHKSSVSTIETLNAFRQAVGPDGTATIDDQRRAADRYIEACDLLCRRIVRHLDDEEDLVIPLMLAHK